MSERRISDKEIMKIHLERFLIIGSLRTGYELTRYFFDLLPDIGSINLYLSVLAIYGTGQLLDWITTAIGIINNKKLNKYVSSDIYELNPLLPQKPEIIDLFNPRLIISNTVDLIESMIFPPYGLLVKTPSKYRAVFSNIGLIKQKRRLIEKYSKG